MTPSRPIAAALRLSIPATLTIFIFGSNAPAQGPSNALISGVYNGSYTCAQGPRTLKLVLQASGNGSLAGIFTFYVPPTPQGRAFSYSLNGTFDATSGRFRLNPVQWVTPQPGSYSMVGMDGTFDSRTGQVSGKITLARCGPFQATRNPVESANSTGILSPQGVARSGLQTPQTAATATQATSITGVYNGTVTCIGGTANLKLSLSADPNGIVTGFAILDLPPNLPPGPGSRATYKLTGKFNWTGHTYLFTPAPWGPQPPSGYTMGQLHGAYYPSSDMLAGQVYGQHCSDFHTNRTKSETPEAIAAALQKEPVAIPVVPHPAAVEAKIPPPTSVAPPGLVRKSRAYWGAYHTDILRQVFDGGFGANVDSDKQFQLLFNGYVDDYSKTCRAYLPAQHVTVGITQVAEKRDRNGNVLSQQELQSGKVEADSRFAETYRAYAESLTSSTQTLAGAVGIMSGRVQAN
jgi:hypothetical protein